jgi:cation:H+ antiporter
VFAWSAFIVCVILIVVAGVKLCRYGDILAEKTGLGGTWIGLVMVAAVTSLPELATGIASVTVAAAPDIAAGDVLGSCVFNLLIVVILDLMHRGESVYTRASQGHILGGAFGVMLIGFIAFNIVLSSDGASLAIGHVGIYSPVVLILYAVAMRTLYRYERRQIAEFPTETAERHGDISVEHAALRYAVAALVVVAAGVALPFVAKILAIQMEWSQSFVGTLFVALATSLPEVVVTVAALRIGAVDMAIGNLLGSNLFNILILAIDDIAYVQGPLLSDISPAHAISALSALMMTGAAIAGLLYRPRGRVFKTVGWVSIVLFVVYVLNTYVLFLYGIE